METGHELFVHGLGDMLDAEQQLVEALGELAEDSSRGDLKKAFEQHQKQTEEHVQRLQQSFELLGEETNQSECHGIRGIIEEKKAFAEEDPSDDLVDVFNIGAGMKSETYEICEYESLIDMAKEMKHTKVAQLLNQNLRDEKETLKKLKSFSTKVKPDEMMNDEQRERAESSSRAQSSSRSSRRKRAA